MKGYKAIAEVLLAHKADVNIRDRNGATPLHLSARDGFLSVVELLLTNGAEVNAPADNGQTPLHYAASDSRTSVMELLFAHKADVNARARDGTTPLMTAVLYSQAGAARLLMEHGANVNAARTDAGNFRDWMPLHFAVYHDEPELVKLLLENKADVNARVPIYPAASPVGRAGRGFGGGGAGGFGRGGPRTTPLGSPGGNNGSYADVTPLAATVIGGQPKIAQLLLRPPGEYQRCGQECRHAAFAGGDASTPGHDGIAAGARGRGGFAEQGSSFPSEPGCPVQLAGHGETAADAQTRAGSDGQG